MVRRKDHPVKPLGDDYVMELFNGPTSAFKDIALQILPRFMARTTPTGGDDNEKIMIVTATSGDTGKAALAGFADAEHGHHRVLSGRQGQPGTGTADEHTGRFECKRVRSQGQFR